jgi:hypothetical protein
MNEQSSTAKPSRTRTLHPNRERAKRVVLELLRQAGGQLSKSLLHKAFWLAHLYYFKQAPGYLTDWPIVRLPNGPGIDKADRLLQELSDSGHLAVKHEPKGPFTEVVCCLTQTEPEGELPEQALSAIKEAVDLLKGHSPESISELSHDFSRSWNSQPEGAELDIYTDLIPDDLYQERRKEAARLKKAYEDLFE